MLKGKQAQCPICDLIFTSNNACEVHKRYRDEEKHEYPNAKCVHPSTIGMVERERGWTVPLPEDAKTWSTQTYEPKGPQILTCESCSVIWERPAQRGRKPKLCVDCKTKGA